jgi:hypothetical protein
MNTKLCIRYALTMCLTVAIFATYSMVALAYDGKTAGEILVTGNDGASSVTVNGEAAKSGRTIFSSSTISTTDTAGAVLSLGKAGRIELAHNTTLTISFDENTINGNLTSGSITVLNAANAVDMKTLSGDVKLNTGESTAASSTAPSKAPSGASHSNWGWWALIVGGAVAVIIWTAADGGENRFGQNGSVIISPVR